MERALRKYQVAGLANNIDFCLRIVQHDTFANGIPTTAFFDHHMDEIMTKMKTNPMKNDGFIDNQGHVSLAMCALNTYRIQSSEKGHHAAPDVWSSNQIGSYRIGVANVSNKYHSITNMFNETVDTITVSSSNGNGNENTLFIQSTTDGNDCNGQTIRIVSVQDGIGADNSVGSRCYDMSIEVDGVLVNGTSSIYTNLKGDTIVDCWLEGKTGDDITHSQFTIPPASYVLGDSASGTPMVKAPMPGQVIKLLVSTGDNVKAGEPVFIMNAMKMEHVVNAPTDGVISVACVEGDMVMDGAILAEIAVASDKA
jgi:acetyl/propionyl-CoA carboxylase alpha subunit